MNNYSDDDSEFNFFAGLDKPDDKKLTIQSSP